MPNSAYLCCTDYEGLYPSFVDENYRSSESTLAVAQNCIPLLWLALFRRDDMRREIFIDQGVQVAPIAPLADRDKCIDQLEDALPRLDALFCREGRLDEHVECLKRDLLDMTGEYVTIEMEEIVVVQPNEQAYYETLRRGMDVFDMPVEKLSPRGKGQKHRQFRKLLATISDLRLPGQFITPGRFREGGEFDPNQHWNYARLRGVELYHPLSWE